MASSADQPLIDTVQAAKLCNVTTQTIRYWINHERLTGVKVGRRYRVRLSEVEELLEGKRNVDGIAAPQWGSGQRLQPAPDRERNGMFGSGMLLVSPTTQEGGGA